MRYLLLLLTANCSRIPTIEEGPVIPLASQTVCVFLVKWFDHQGRRLPTRDEVSAHLNSEDPTSARSWFSEVSHTEVEVTFHVHEWLASPASEAEASGGAFGLGASLNTAVIVRRGFNDDQRALRSQPLDLSPCGQRFHAVLFHSGFDGCWYGKDPHGTAWVSRRAINSRVDRVHAQMTFIYEEVGGASLQRLAVQSVLWGWTQQIARRGTMIHEWMHTQGLTDMCGPRRDRKGRRFSG
ncbi:MAG: uncharacterized protein KVP18_004939 [Porospora cf. gigantea A]|uniref:uncharacterized protein n=1 Tax=Porospora cf. gigantea A TaxID=2853593 RepID=UPI00355A7F7E|nr:MAG: hypothetical protein KVP18_004939 [Porospora cf. gigantea A]